MSILKQLKPNDKIIKAELNIYERDFKLIKFIPEYLSKLNGGTFHEQDILSLLTKELKDDEELIRSFNSKKKRGRPISKKIEDNLNE